MLSGATRRDTAVVVHISVLISNMEKDNCGYNKHETFDDLMDFYKEVASDYDQVNNSISYITLTFSMRYVCK